MKEQIELLENDIRRASAHVKQAHDMWDKDRSERNYGTWSIYQNILDKLEIKLQEIRNV